MAQMFGLARIGRDVELRYTQEQQAVVNLSLAFNYGRKGSDGKRPTQWVDASLWGKLAEALQPYLTRGTAVSVTLDDVHIETFQGRNGDGHKLVGRVSAIELAGGGEGQRQQQQPPARQQQRPPQNNSGGFDDMDDDQNIPF